MADAKKCDRCGIFYEPGMGFFGKKHIRKPGNHHSYYDLCENCQHDLDKFMEGAPVGDYCAFICTDTDCVANKEMEDDGR